MSSAPFLSPGHDYYLVWTHGDVVRYVPNRAPARILIAAPVGALLLHEADMHALATVAVVNSWHPEEDGTAHAALRSGEILRTLLRDAGRGRRVDPDVAAFTRHPLDTSHRTHRDTRADYLIRYPAV